MQNFSLYEIWRNAVPEFEKRREGDGDVVENGGCDCICRSKTTGKTTGRGSRNEAFDANVSNAWSGTADSCSAGIFLHGRLGMWGNF